jgi:hypothetical protein
MKAVHTVETSGINNPAIRRNKPEELNPVHIVALFYSWLTSQQYSWFSREYGYH